MKKIIVALMMLFCLSCSNVPFLNNDSSSNMSSEQNYINLQVKLHTAYSLLKSLNLGAISQEEYDKLKVELFKN